MVILEFLFVEAGQKSYAQALVKSSNSSSFKLAMQNPMDVDGDLGFVF